MNGFIGTLYGFKIFQSDNMGTLEAASMCLSGSSGTTTCTGTGTSSTRGGGGGYGHVMGNPRYSNSEIQEIAYQMARGTEWVFLEVRQNVASLLLEAIYKSNRDGSIARAMISPDPYASQDRTIYPERQKQFTVVSKWDVGPMVASSLSNTVTPLKIKKNDRATRHAFLRDRLKARQNATV